MYNLHRLQLLKPCLLCYLVLTIVGITLQMPHIRNVPHISHLVAQMSEQTYKNIVCYTWPCVSQMGITIYGRSAHVQAHHTRHNWFEEFLPSA